MDKIILQFKKEQKITVEEYNAEIEESLKQINKGKFKTQKEVVKLIKTFGKKKISD